MTTFSYPYLFTPIPIAFLGHAFAQAIHAVHFSSQQIVPFTFFLLPINLHNFLVILINGIEADVLTVLAICFTQLLITPELFYLFFQIFPVTTLKQLAGLTDLNQFRDASDVCSQHRCEDRYRRR